MIFQKGCVSTQHKENQRETQMPSQLIINHEEKQRKGSENMKNKADLERKVKKIIISEVTKKDIFICRRNRQGTVCGI